jgi:hypothetical protein
MKCSLVAYPGNVSIQPASWVSLTSKERKAMVQDVPAGARLKCCVKAGHHSAVSGLV